MYNYMEKRHISTWEETPIITWERVIMYRNTNTLGVAMPKMALKQNANLAPTLWLAGATMIQCGPVLYQKKNNAMLTFSMIHLQVKMRQRCRNCTFQC